MAKFLVLDLDKESFIEDTRTINKICTELNIMPLIELSKSGNGIHIWFFFETLVSASSARKLGDILITKAMDIANSINMSSYVYYPNKSRQLFQNPYFILVCNPMLHFLPEC